MGIETWKRIDRNFEADFILKKVFHEKTENGVKVDHHWRGKLRVY